jgi:hypothetical protein
MKNDIHHPKKVFYFKLWAKIICFNGCLKSCSPEADLYINSFMWDMIPGNFSGEVRERKEANLGYITEQISTMVY